MNNVRKDIPGYLSAVDSSIMCFSSSGEHLLTNKLGDLGVGNRERVQIVHLHILLTLTIQSCLKIGNVIL